MTEDASSSDGFDGATPLLERPVEERQIGPYRLIRRLGQGGFAPVWLAEEIHEGTRLRDVAVKVFLEPRGMPRGSAAAWRERIVAEARALCRVEHPNVVRFYALHRDDAAGAVGLAMEYVAGVSLSDHLQARGPLPPEVVAEAGAAIAWALSAVHHAGLCHRDVKPANVIAGAAGYKLIDFGIGVDTTAMPAAAASIAGTRGYIAPECLEHGAPPSTAVDLYALGATLYRLLTGALPGRLDALPPPPKPLPAPLFEVVQRLLDPSPLSRPHHAEWVARELERARAALSPATHTPSQAPHALAPALVSADAETAGVRHAELPTQSTSGLAEPVLCHDPPLVGRGDAIAALERAAREAREGGVRLVLLTGPLGAGRSRLLARAIGAAALPEARVLHARCSPERRSPLRPLLRAVDALPPGAGGPLGQLRDAIERAISPRALGGAVDVAETLEGVEDAMLWASADEPLLLAIDDLQWGDAHTLELLRLLVERAALPEEARLLVVATARDEPSPSAPLRALLGQVCARVRPGVKHLPLGPLTPGEAARLAQGIGPLGLEVEQAVARGSGGVPFFAVHAIVAWHETGAIVWRGGAFRAASGQALLADVPGVATLLAARLAAWFDAGSALERSALRALTAAALYGGGLAVEIIFEVGGEEASLERALDVLVGAGILTIAGDRQEYGFAAEMVRQAMLNLARQRPWFSRLYRALLDAVARGAGATVDAAFLATGYERLGAPDAARVWLRRAMEAAAAAGLFAEAAELGDRLAALTMDPDARAGVTLDVVHALIRGRQFEDAKQRLARLAEVTAPPGAPPSLHALRRRIHQLAVKRGLYEAGEDPDLLADADAAGEPALACEARMALAGVAPEEHALPLAGEAIALAERLGPPHLPLKLAARVLRVELVYAAGRRDLELARGDLVRALGLAEAAASPFLALHIEADLAPVEADLGELDAAIERLQRLLARAEALGMRGQHRLLSQNLSVCLLRAGRVVEAAAAAQRTAALAAVVGDPVLRASALSIRADALRRTGDLEGALSTTGEAERIQRERGDRMRALTLLRRAEILEALGRAEEALLDAQEARAVAEQHGEQAVAATAVLWEALHRARRGDATPDHLRGTLAAAEAAGAGARALTRSLMAQAEAWLTASTETAS